MCDGLSTNTATVSKIFYFGRRLQLATLFSDSKTPPSSAHHGVNATFSGDLT